jgi:uncharacterized membrane protein YfcA
MKAFRTFQLEQWPARALRIAVLLCLGLMAACGGGYGGGMGGGGGMASAPVITAQPMSQSVTAGSMATFSVTATGAGLSYQWMKNSVNIANATAATYTTPPTTTADSGSAFAVQVSNVYGHVTSSPAMLTVM